MSELFPVTHEFSMVIDPNKSLVCLSEVEKQVDDIIAADYIATNTVDYWTDFRVLGSNIPVSKTSDFLNATPVSYIANINIYIKTS